MKKIIVLVLTLGLLLCMAACSEEVIDAAKTALTGDISIAEAKTLCQGDLDGLFHGSASQEYLDMVGDTQENVALSYQENLVTDAEAFAYSYAIENYTADIEDRLVDILDQVYQKTDFVLGEGERTEDGSIVISVTVRPVDVIVLLDEALTVTSEPFNAQYTQEMVDAMTEEEYLAYDGEWAALVLDTFEAQLPNMGYEAERVTEVTVAKDTDGYWCMTQDSLQNVYDLLIDWNY